MNLHHLPTTQLNPAPYNPRKPLRPDDPAYRRLQRSMEEFDLVQPIVWNERTGHVVAGHQRLEIARARGQTTLPCVVVDLPLAREKALNVALNNPALGSEWDDHRLQDLLIEMQQTDGLDATLTGFDADELQDLLMEPAQPEPCPPDADRDNRVRVTLLITHTAWKQVRHSLERIAKRDGVELHAQLGHQA